MLRQHDASPMPFDNLLPVIVLDRRDTLAHSALRNIHARRRFLHRTGLCELHERFEVLNQLTQLLLEMKKNELIAIKIVELRSPYSD